MDSPYFCRGLSFASSNRSFAPRCLSSSLTTASEFSKVQLAPLTQVTKPTLPCPQVERRSAQCSTSRPHLGLEDLIRVHGWESSPPSILGLSQLSKGSMVLVTNRNADYPQLLCLLARGVQVTQNCGISMVYTVKIAAYRSQSRISMDHQI